MPGRKQSLGSGAAECLTSIPKDESLKCTKTKNIALRSKSVDFKFFDELKESYFSKRAAIQSPTQVFGQSLYKCILNDLQRGPGAVSNSKVYIICCLPFGLVILWIVSIDRSVS